MKRQRETARQTVITDKFAEVAIIVRQYIIDDNFVQAAIRLYDYIIGENNKKEKEIALSCDFHDNNHCEVLLSVWRSERNQYCDKQ